MSASAFRPRAVLAVLALLAALSAAGLARPAAVHAAAPTPQYALTFDDEFNGTAVDTSVWNHRTDVRGNSAQRAENVSESGGAMHIALKAESYNGKSFTGGGLVSKAKFRYGYYETRMRLNTGPGWHSAFWSTCGAGHDIFSDCKPRPSEIDGFEIDSASPRDIRMNAYGTTTSTTGNYDMGFDSSAGWHTYGYDYEETGVSQYIDGVLTRTIPFSAADNVQDWVNLWLTTIAFNNTPDPAQLPATVDWDYVRYYQQGYYVDNDGPTQAGYSESGPGWETSSLPGFAHSTSRYSCSPGVRASWTFTPPAGGTYRVDTWNIVDQANPPDIAYRVSPAEAGPHTVAGRSGTTGWVTLGTDRLPAGTAQTVTATGSGTGCLRADSVRFVRVA